jgi:NADH-quinone oxidoreductase subunit C
LRCRETSIELLTFLRDDAQCQFVSFIDICGVDYPGREKRFDVVYHLLSPPEPAHPGEGDDRRDVPVPSLTSVFPAPTGSSAKPMTVRHPVYRPSRTCAAS